MSEIEIDADGYISPLRSMALETNELYEELCTSGYPTSVAAMIIAHILGNALDSRAEYGIVSLEDEDDDDDDDDDDGVDF